MVDVQTVAEYQAERAFSLKTHALEQKLARADARIAELERECTQWRDELRIYRETESKRIAELEAEVARLRVDAERYRWLRKGHVRGPYIVDYHGCAIRHEDADGDIDAARAGNGGGS